MKHACERCGMPLDAKSEAYSCSYDCTFCATCNAALAGVCPNCGGALVLRTHTGGMPSGK